LHDRVVNAPPGAFERPDDLAAGPNDGSGEPSGLKRTSPSVEKSFGATSPAVTTLPSLLTETARPYSLPP